MIPSRRLDFARRHNPDGTYDSICQLCLETITTQRDTRFLTKFEQAHQCVKKDLRPRLRLDRDLGHLRMQLEAVLRYSQECEN